MLVNDFGAVNIDAELVRSKSSNTIDLSNGCVCCTVAGDLTRAFVQVAQRDELPDCIVLEASGVANPRGILHVALTNPSIRFDGIVTVMDADELGEWLAALEFHVTMQCQIDAANLMLLNKCDLVSADGLEAARETLRKISDARVVNTRFAELPIEIVLGMPLEHLSAYQCDISADSNFKTWSRSWAGALNENRLKARMK